MIFKIPQALLTVALLFTFGCTDKANEQVDVEASQSARLELEKAAIMATLNNETKAAFQRKYEQWEDYWVHHPKVTKTYINFVDSTFSESIGWEEISQFVKKFIDEHPEPEPLPELIDDIDVRLYGEGASVSYEQQDALRGLKRETRLMEKENGEWKIAGMHTTIYGF